MVLSMIDGYLKHANSRGYLLSTVDVVSQVACTLQLPVVVNRKQQLCQPGDIFILDGSDLVTDLLEQLVAQTTLPPGVDIDARGGEEGLLEISDGPTVILVAVAENLPVAGGEFEKATTSPTVGTEHGGVRGVDALDLLLLVTVDGLVLDQVIQHLGVVGQRPVCDGHVAVRLPHGQRAVGDVPSPL